MLGPPGLHRLFATHSLAQPGLLGSQPGLRPRECQREVREAAAESASKLRAECGAPGADPARFGSPSPDVWRIVGISRAGPPFPPTPTQVEGEQLSPQPMLVKISAQHGTDISGEPGTTITGVGRVLLFGILTVLGNARQSRGRRGQK